MIRISRSLATRLRRIVRPSQRQSASLGTRPASSEAWARLERALTAPIHSADATRRHELAHEQLRLAVTLVGQQGGRAVARIVAAGGGDAREGGEAIRIALAVAALLGHAV